MAVTFSTAREVLELSGDVKHLMLMSDQVDIPVFNDLYGLAWAARADDVAAAPEAYEAWCRAAETTTDYIVEQAPEERAVTISEALDIDTTIAAEVVANQVYERYDTDLPIDRIVTTFDTYAAIGLIDERLEDPERFVHGF